MGRPRLLILYHFFHPDPVVSAPHLLGLRGGAGPARVGVTALTCNRSHLDEGARYPARRRPGTASRFAASSARPGRRNIRCRASANSAWLLSAWFLRTLELGAFDAIVIGSDPSFAASMAIPLRAAARARRSFIGASTSSPTPARQSGPARTRLLSRPARALMSAAYRRCDVVVDLGPCMRRRLERYGGAPLRETLTPWALVEPETPAEPIPPSGASCSATRRSACSTRAACRARTTSRACCSSRAPAARAPATQIALAFACTGTNLPALKAAVGPDDTNVPLCALRRRGRPAARLEAADFHVGSLRPDVHRASSCRRSSSPR